MSLSRLDLIWDWITHEIILEAFKKVDPVRFRVKSPAGDTAGFLPTLALVWARLPRRKDAHFGTDPPFLPRMSDNRSTPAKWRSVMN